MNLGKDYESALSDIENGLWENAISKLTNAILLNNNEVEYYSKRGVCYLNLEKYDLSMFDFNRALELDPNYSYRYSCRAFLKTRIKDLKGAVEDYEMALKLDPDDPIIYNNMGLIVEQMGQVKKAERYFNKSNDLEGYNPEKRFGEGDSNDIEKPMDTVPSGIKEPFKSEPNRRIEGSILAKKVFTEKQTFREFIRFIKNGLKSKK